MEKGDRFGLFYGRTKIDGAVYFFGYGTYQGEHIFTIEEVRDLATAMPFEAVPNSPRTGGLLITQDLEQHMFVLENAIEEENSIIYDQECWFIEPKKAEEVLKAAPKIHMLSIKDLRDAHMAVYNLPRVKHGHVDIYMSFEKVVVPSDADTDAEIEHMILNQLRGNEIDGTESPFAHLPDSAFEIKVRHELNHLCCRDDSHGVAVGVRYPKEQSKEDDEEILLPLCSKCLQEHDAK